MRNDQQWIYSIEEQFQMKDKVFKIMETFVRPNEKIRSLQFLIKIEFSVTFRILLFERISFTDCNILVEILSEVILNKLDLKINVEILKIKLPIVNSNVVLCTST